MDLRVMTAEKSAQSEEYRRIWFGASNKHETVFQRFAQHEENRKEKLQLRANIYTLTDHLKHSANELFAKEARHDDSGISLERPSSSRSSSASGSPTASALSPSIATTCAPPGKPESLDDSTREAESPSSSAAAGPSLAAVCSTTQRGHHHHFRCAMCGLTDFEDIHSFFQHCSDHQETKLSVPHLNCSICSQALLSKESLLAHLLTDHMEPDKQCRRCNFHTEDMDEAEAHRFACYNVQRKKGKKRKQSRCQKCKATAPNKWELYKHNIAHVNMSRALYCDFCPFVTDLKHHMEYHTFNHSGTKPLKCTQCTYTCVNKAMLKSHMKIHSNICDFQCNDCTYQAKYHTVLKKHLQETKHSQKITYFPDGSQVQMIDVIGSKRGPKAATTSLKPPRETVTSRRTAAQPYNRPTMVNNEPLANMLMLPLPILKCHNCEFITSNEFALLKHNYERHSVVSRQVAAAILMEQIRAMQVAANQFAGGTINLTTSPQTLEDSEKEEKMEAEPTTENDNDGANQVAAKQVWSCRDCDMHFLESNKFLIHMGYHSAPDKFTCRLCGQKTGNRNAFIFHVGNHDPRH